VERGGIWWVRLDEPQLVVVLSTGPGPGILAAQIVAPATETQKRGYLVLTGRQALDVAERQRILAPVGPATVTGVEVAMGLPEPGVVRLAFPREGKIFCSWLVTVAPDDLIEQAGALTPERLHELDAVLALTNGPRPSPGSRRDAIAIREDP
jgi:mRNA interferase MazF